MAAARELTIDSLTGDEWTEIRSLAFAIYRSGQYGKDQTKCCVAAFLAWIANQPGDVSMIVGEAEAASGAVH